MDITSIVALLDSLQDNGSYDELRVVFNAILVSSSVRMLASVEDDEKRIREETLDVVKKLFYNVVVEKVEIEEGMYEIVISNPWTNWEEVDTNNRGALFGYIDQLHEDELRPPGRIQMYSSFHVKYKTVCFELFGFRLLPTTSISAVYNQLRQMMIVLEQVGATAFFMITPEID